MLSDQLSVTFQALADPTRRAILSRLFEGEATVTELAEPFPVSLPAISRHLKVLERAGLISRDRSAQYRPSTLRVEPLKEATEWMEPYRELWQGRMDRLGAHLDNLKKGPADMPDSATQSDRHVAIVRTFDAPPDQVWRAWVEPEQVARWWGPEGFETPLDSVVIEPRPGGRYDLLMVDTGSGKQYPVRQEVLEASAPELLVLRHAPMPEHGMVEAIVTRIEFHAADGGTRLEISGGPYPAEMGPNAEAGWSQQLDKLARLLG